MSNLDRAIAKSEYLGVRDQWCAYLTPAEFVALYDAGAIPSQRACIDHARASMAKGDTHQRWYYFAARTELRAMLPKTNKKVGTKEKL